MVMIAPKNLALRILIHYIRISGTCLYWCIRLNSLLVPQNTFNNYHTTPTIYKNTEKMKNMKNTIYTFNSPV